MTYGNLSGVLRRVGQHMEALVLCRKALAIEEKVYGVDHPEVAITTNNLAQVLKTLGYFDEAEAAHRRALHVFEEQLGPEHGETITTVHNLAFVLKVNGGSGCWLLRLLVVK